MTGEEQLIVQGLVDELGGVDPTIEKAAERAGVGDDLATVLEYVKFLEGLNDPKRIYTQLLTWRSGESRC